MEVFDPEQQRPFNIIILWEWFVNAAQRHRPEKDKA